MSGVRGRGRSRLPAEQRAWCGAPCGAQFQDPEIMTPAVGRCLNDWAPQAPPRDEPCIKSGLPGVANICLTNICSFLFPVNILPPFWNSQSLAPSPRVTRACKPQSPIFQSPVSESHIVAGFLSRGVKEWISWTQKGEVKRKFIKWSFHPWTKERYSRNQHKP